MSPTVGLFSQKRKIRLFSKEPDFLRPNALLPPKGAPHEKPGKARRALAGPGKTAAAFAQGAAQRPVPARQGEPIEIKKSAALAVFVRSRPGARPGPTDGPARGRPAPAKPKQRRVLPKKEEAFLQAGALLRHLAFFPSSLLWVGFPLGRGKPLARGCAGCVSGWAAGMQAGAGSKRGKPG